MGVGVTAAQKWDVSVFVVPIERPCDWGDLAGVGATACEILHTLVKSCWLRKGGGRVTRTHAESRVGAGLYV